MTTYITVCEVVLKCVAAILFVMIILLSVLYRRDFVQNCIFMNKYLTFVNISRGFFLDSISCRIEGYLHPSGLLLPIISHWSKIKIVINSFSRCQTTYRIQWVSQLPQWKPTRQVTCFRLHQVKSNHYESVSYLV